MTKTGRSPLTGYNHNVQHLGRVFHVQTEDSGPVNPHIFTHLFFGGTILVSKKHRYEAVTPDETVRKLMQAQHKSMLRELVQAQHDERIRGFFAAKGEDLPVEMPGAQPAVVMANVDSRPMSSGLAAAAPAAGSARTPPPVLVSGRTPPPELRPTPPPELRPSPPAELRPTPPAAPLRSAARLMTPAPFAHTPPPSVTPPPLVAPAGAAAPSSTNARLPQATPQPVRSPFARSGPNAAQPASAASASSEAVVVQRSIVVGAGRPRQEVVVGAPQAASAVPHVVTTGRHTAALRSAATPAPAAVAQARSRGVTPAGAASQYGSAGTPAWGAAVTPPPSVRPIGPLLDDKSLDEVILEYLADDGVDEGLG